MGLFKSAEEKYQIGLAAYQAGDYEKAHKWIGKAAGASPRHAEAAYLFATMYDTGKTAYGKRDPAMFTFYLKRAAEVGHAEAQFRYGQMCINMDKEVEAEDRNYRMGFRWCQRASEKGHHRAQFICGQCLEKGIGTDVDRAAALAYYLSAAEADHMEAQYACGRLIASTTVDGAKAEALKWYEKAAQQGHGEAQLACARMYAAGEGTEADTVKAYDWAKKAKENAVDGAGELWQKLGEKEAAKILPAAIEAHEAGDYQKAFPLWGQAAEMGVADAQYFYGTMYQKGQGASADPVKAFYWLECAAKQGHESAQVQCGAMCDKGEGTSVDKKQALAWYEKAAEQGNTKGALYCMQAYYRGLDVPRNLEKAFFWAEAVKESSPEAQSFYDMIQTENEAYRKAKTAYTDGDYTVALPLFEQAANQGNEEAIYYCALMYEKGLGTEENFDKAKELYKEAAEKGYAEAQVWQGEMFSRFSDHVAEEKVQDALSLSLRWYLQAANQDHAVAQFHCGLCYLHGKGTEQDFKTALRWFERAAKQGQKAAQYNLGLMYESGLGTETDKAKACFWFEKAAEQGLAKAQYKCGFMYRYGEGTEKDPHKALYWYEQAARQGDMTAQKECGIMYRHGWDGIQRDIEKAAYWLEKAAAQGDKGAQNLLDELKFF